MTTGQLRARDLPQVLDEIGAGPYPDYVDDVLTTTATARQRPAWTFPARWVPHALTPRQPVAALQVPWRSMAMVMLVLALLLAVVAVVASMRTRLPAPYGPAANGLIAWDEDGDIYVADVAASKPVPLVTGIAIDVDPEWSLDGTRIVFERRLNTGTSQLYSVASTGGEPRLLTPQPVSLAPAEAGRAWKRYEFSPDGRSILVSLVQGGMTRIALVAADGSGHLRLLDVGMEASEPSFRPPDGREVLFIGRGVERGLYAVEVATNAVRPVRVLPRDVDLAGPSWSPDGTEIAYWTWAPSGQGLTAHSRVISSDGSGDRRLPRPAGEVWNAHATWSNDGTRLFLARAFTPAFNDVRGYVAPADGSAVGVEVAPAGMVETECCAAWSWSPDDRFVLGRHAPTFPTRLRQVLVDASGRGARRLSWTTSSDPAWQRLAP